eukprot:m.45873 g.45873  ORF g.45873 m.45873 type:complete len:146 (-) comp15146_c0_seq2:413-850(-)
MPIRFAVSFHVFSDASCYSGDTTAGTLLYTVGSELFFTENAESVQKQTLRDIENHPEVIERLGTGLTALGAPTHAEYKVEDMLYLRMKFLVHGASGQGTVQLEVKKKQVPVFPSILFLYKYKWVCCHAPYLNNGCLEVVSACVCG